MRAMPTAVAILILSLATGGCGQSAATDGRAHRPDAPHEEVDCEEAARRTVEAYIQREKVDVTGMEFYFARFQDTTGRYSAFSGEFGPRVWIVKYGRTRGPSGLMTAGAGILFYVDAKTGNTLMWRERD